MRIISKRPLTPDERRDCLAGWLEKKGVYRNVDRGVPPEAEEEIEHSAFMLGGKSTFETIKRAYKLGTDTLIAMHLKKRPTLRLDNKSHNTGVDGVNVRVGTKVFDDKDLEVGEQLDVFIGNVVHEGIKIKYSEPLYKWKTRLHKWVAQLMADEYSERQLFAEMPGFAGFVEKRRKYYFEKVYMAELEKLKLEKVHSVAEDGSLTSEEGPLTRFLTILMKIIRYPEWLKEKEIDELGDRLLGLKPILSPFPLDWEATKEAIEKIVDLIIDLISEEMAKELEGEEEVDEETGVTVIVLSKAESDKLKKMIEDAMGSELGDESPLGVLMAIKDGAGVENMAAILLVDPFAVPDMEGTCEKVDDMTAFFPEADNRTAYRECYDRIRRYIPALSKELVLRGAELKYVERGHRNGMLDTNKLVEGKQGEETIYVRQGIRYTTRMAIGVLVDESGSMGGRSIDAARDMAVLLNEVLQKVPNVDFYIYGHSADQIVTGSTELYIYREPKFPAKYSIGSMVSRANNRDGVAILNTAKRIRKYTQEPGIIFVLSDGQPSAYGYGGNVTHTRAMVQQVQRNMKFQVIQIAINHSFEPKLMFDHYMILTDLGKLAFNLGKVVKKAVEKNTSVHYHS